MAKLVLDAHSKHIAKIVSGAKTRRLAVAFWGRGAIELLGLDKGSNDDTKIICDLMSGACNPETIRDLMKLFGADNVRTRDGLHSKVYWTPGAVVLGSSNASSNGLAVEEGEGDTVEANVVLRDQDIVDELAGWFSTQWDDPRCRKIEGDMLATATMRHQKRRAARPKVERPARGKLGLREQIERDPTLLADRLYFFIYPDLERSKESSKQWDEDIRKGRLESDPKIFAYEDERKFLEPIYEYGRQFVDIEYDPDASPAKRTVPCIVQVGAGGTHYSKIRGEKNWCNFYCTERSHADFGFGKVVIDASDRKWLRDLLPEPKIIRDYCIFGPIQYLTSGRVKTLTVDELRKAAKGVPIPGLGVLVVQQSGSTT